MTENNERLSFLQGVPLEGRFVLSSLMVGVALTWLPILRWKGSSLKSILIPSHTPFNGSIKAKVFTSLLIVLSHFPLERVIGMKFGVILYPWMHAMFFWEGLGFLIEG